MSAPAVMATTATPAPGFIRCCHPRIALSHAYVRAAWRPNGVQCVGDGGPDLELFTCTQCGTTRGIEIPCSHGVRK